jgi:cytidylate kinase
MKRLTVAIDGPAGAGKSTAAREVARRLGYLYIDTGAMYRAVALKASREGVSPEDPAALTALAERTEIRLESGQSECVSAPGGAMPGDRSASGAGAPRVFLDGQEVGEAIRSPEITALSSRVSVVPGVRQAMVQRQRAMGRDGGVVMEGRDIGTVVFPEADVKVFVDASVEERARRRQIDLRAQGIEEPLDTVRQAILERDARDSQRATSPLRQADDAIRLVTDHLPIEEVIDRIVALCDRVRSRP